MEPRDTGLPQVLLREIVIALALTESKRACLKTSRMIPILLTIFPERNGNAVARNL